MQNKGQVGWCFCRWMAHNKKIMNASCLPCVLYDRHAVVLTCSRTDCFSWLHFALSLQFCATFSILVVVGQKTCVRPRLTRTRTKRQAVAIVCLRYSRYHAFWVTLPFNVRALYIWPSSTSRYVRELKHSPKLQLLVGVFKTIVIFQVVLSLQVVKMRELKIC